MKRKIFLAAVVPFLWAGTAQAEEDYRSGNHMLPLCKAWLGMISNDVTRIQNELATGNASPGGIPAHFMQVGMCAGEVAGIADILNGSDQIPAACIPKGVTREQVVRVVVTTLEQAPGQLNEDFAASAAAAIVIAWPCHK